MRGLSWCHHHCPPHCHSLHCHDTSGKDSLPNGSKMTRIYPYAPPQCLEHLRSKNWVLRDKLISLKMKDASGCLQKPNKANKGQVVEGTTKARGLIV